MKAYGLQGMGGGTGGTGVSNGGFSSGGTYGQYQVCSYCIALLLFSNNLMKGGTKNGGGYPNVGKKY